MVYNDPAIFIEKHLILNDTSTFYMRFGHIEECYYQIVATAQRPTKYNVFSHITAR
jgi:hypothetical protein